MNVITITCSYCNTLFENYKSANSKFCSRKCFHLSTKGKSTWNKNLKGYNADYPRSKEWCENISKSKIGHIVSEETRRKISEAEKGRISNRKWKKHTEETKEILRKKTLKQFENGVPEETIRKQKETFLRNGSNKREKNGMFGRCGDKSPTWQGGISFEPYGLEFNKDLKEIIRNRDQRKCKLCNIAENGKKLDIHHCDYDKKHNDSENLVSLCRKCHTKTNNNRSYWINYFHGVKS